MVKETRIRHNTADYNATVLEADRHQFRAKWHDYNGGVYFVTICSYGKKHSMGSIMNNVFYPSELGEFIKEHIEKLSGHYTDVEVWNSVIMPKHIHLVIAVGTRLIASEENAKNIDTIDNVRLIASEEHSESNLGCLRQSNHKDECGDFHHNSRLASIVGSFKAGISRTARTRKIASLPVWQSRFHEHIIREQRAFENIMNYIDTNVENWSDDCFAN